MTRHAGCLLALVAGLTLTLFTPTRASAQRLGGHFLLGLGGEGTVTTSTELGDVEGGEWSLDPTLGFGLRADFPLHDFVLLGALFQGAAFDPDGRTDAQWMFDFDLVAKVRYAIELGDGLALEPYGAIPFGFTLADMFDPEQLLDDDARSLWPGWNLGVLAGLNLLFGAFGAYFELGWHHHQVYRGYDGALGADVDVKVVVNQFVMHLGAMFVIE